ncbi:MAG: trypsin-like peptidase domain-containing protein [Phycisphaerales bacterium]|jgi:serine protease Do|nr:trypsin-like peptidase domain-containing protein [Phycisphaerales bacterium]
MLHSRNHARPISLTARAAILVFAAGTLMAPHALANGPAQPTDNSRHNHTITNDHARQAADDISLAFEHAAGVIGPSVVHVTTQSERTVITRDGLGRTMPRRQQASGLGSGVVISADGYILTNNHVVEDATQLVAVTADGVERPASIIGADPATDVAVIKIDATGLTAAEFADSDQLRIGQWIIAAGSPFGLSNTVTAGIISAKGRTGLGGRMDGDRYEDFLQTDAAINPGNSGGPMVDLDGRIVGINTAIFSRSGGSNGIGFAIPSNIAHNVANALIQTGRVSRGYHGIEMQTHSPDRARDLGIASGVLVARVADDTPAQRAGLRTGDVILRLDDRPTPDDTRLRNAIALRTPGQDVTLDVLRDGQTVSLRASLADLGEASGRSVAQEFDGIYLDDLGLTVADASDALLRKLGYRGGVDAAVIVYVDPDGSASRSGLNVGDLVIAAQGREIDSALDFQHAANRASGKMDIEIVSRGVRSRATLPVPHR